MSFTKLPSTPTEGLKSSSALTFCNPCILNTRSVDSPATVCKAEIRRNRVAALSSELVCPLTCSPFPSSALPTCRCSDDDPCGSTETLDGSEVQSPRPSHSTSTELDKRGEQDVDRTTCSGMFWSRRSCQREQQCNAEINAWFLSFLVVNIFGFIAAQCGRWSAVILSSPAVFLFLPFYGQDFGVLVIDPAAFGCRSFHCIVTFGSYLLCCVIWACEWV